MGQNIEFFLVIFEKFEIFENLEKNWKMRKIHTARGADGDVDALLRAFVADGGAAEP